MKNFEPIVTIRTCSMTDVDALVNLGIQTFTETFGSVNSPEDMAHYLERTFTKGKIAQEFNERGVVFFMALDRETPIGYAKVRDGKKYAALNASKPLEIERLYVIRQMKGVGVGKALMRTCLDHAKASGYDVVWLGVWEHNESAISFYRNWGFRKFDQHIFMLGNDAQTDILMEKSIL